MKHYISHLAFQNQSYDIDGLSYTVLDDEGGIYSLNSKTMKLVDSSWSERGTIEDVYFYYYEYDPRYGSLICVDKYKIEDVYTEEQWNEKLKTLSIIKELQS